MTHRRHVTQRARQLPCNHSLIRALREYEALEQQDTERRLARYFTGTTEEERELLRLAGLDEMREDAAELCSPDDGLGPVRGILVGLIAGVVAWSVITALLTASL